jgi:hypothetical protein
VVKNFHEKVLILCVEKKKKKKIRTKKFFFETLGVPVLEQQRQKQSWAQTKIHCLRTGRWIGLKVCRH